jgi:hypothetical protein
MVPAQKVVEHHGPSRKAVEHYIQKWPDDSLSEVGKANFLISPQIANLQIIELIPLSQICKFLWVIRKSQICKFLQNNAQLCLKTVLKVVFLHHFLLCTIFNWRFICYIFKKEGYTFAEVLSPQITKNWVRKSQIRKGSQLRKVRKSNKFADLRFAELICGSPSFSLFLLLEEVKSQSQKYSSRKKKKRTSSLHFLPILCL